MSNPTNSDETIDSRDVIRRIEELSSEESDFNDNEADREEQDEGYEPETWADAHPEDAEELKHLEAFADEASGYAEDWNHGATLIHRDHFEDYCQELVKDTGGLPDDIPDYLVIDWGATATNLEADYTTVDFDGQEYLVR